MKNSINVGYMAALVCTVVLSSRRGTVPPTRLGSALKSLPGGMCPECLQRKAVNRHPVWMPNTPQLTPLKKKEKPLYFKLLPNDGAPHPPSKAESIYHREKAHFSLLYPQSDSFIQDQSCDHQNVGRQ